MNTLLSNIRNKACQAAKSVKNLAIKTNNFAARHNIGIHLTVRSLHFDRSKPFNEWNIGVAVFKEYNSQVRPVLGGYWNSHRCISFYAGMEPYVRVWDDNIKISAMNGLLSGYDKGDFYVRGSSVRLAVMPTLNMGNRTMGTRIVLAPKRNGLLAFQLYFQPEHIDLDDA